MIMPLENLVVHKLHKCIHMKPLMNHFSLGKNTI